MVLNEYKCYGKIYYMCEFYTNYEIYLNTDCIYYNSNEILNFYIYIYNSVSFLFLAIETFSDTCLV